MSILQYSEELEKRLISWFNVFLPNKTSTFKDFSSGVPFIVLLHEIDPIYFDFDKFNLMCKNEWALCASNLNKVRNTAKDFSNDKLNIEFPFDDIDVNKIAREKDSDELVKMVEMLLAIMVNSDELQKLLAPLLSLPEDQQKPIFDDIGPLIEFYMPNKEQETHSGALMSASTFGSYQKLMEQRDELIEKITNLEGQLESKSTENSILSQKNSELSGLYEAIKLEYHNSVKKQRLSIQRIDSVQDVRVCQELQDELDMSELRVHSIASEKSEMEESLQNKIGHLQDENYLLHQKAAEAAQTKRKMMDLLDKLGEAKTYKTRCEDMERRLEESDRLMAMYKTDEKENKGLRKTNHKLQEELNQARGLISKTELSMNQNTTSSQSILKDKKRLEEQLKFYQEQNESLKEELEGMSSFAEGEGLSRMSTLFGGRGGQSDDLEEKIQRLELENEILSKKMEDGDSSGMDKDVQLTNNKKEILSINQKLDHYKNRNTELEIKTDTLLDKLQKFDKVTEGGAKGLKENKKLKLERDIAFDKLEKLSKTITGYEKLKIDHEKLSEEKSKLMDQLHHIYEDKSKSENLLLKKQEDFITVNKRINVQETTIGRHEKEIQWKDKEITHKEEELNNLKNEINEIKEKYKQDCEAKGGNLADPQTILEKEKAELKANLEIQNLNIQIKKLEDDHRIDKEKTKKAKYEMKYKYDKLNKELTHKHDSDIKKHKQMIKDAEEQGEFYKQMYQMIKTHQKNEEHLVSSELAKFHNFLSEKTGDAPTKPKKANLKLKKMLNVALVSKEGNPDIKARPKPDPKQPPLQKK